MTEQEREKGTPEYLFNKMVDFARRGPAKGVNSFCLKGPIDVPTIFHSFVGLFPQITEEKGLTFVSNRPGIGQIDYYSKILKLAIPERVAKLRVKDIELLRLVGEQVMLAENMPAIVLGFGKAREGSKEVICLFLISGISPKSGLEKLQDRIRIRLAKLN